MVDDALEVLSPEFDRMYAKLGRRLIAPEKLLLQALTSVRSERQWIEQQAKGARQPGPVRPAGSQWGA